MARFFQSLNRAAKERPFLTSCVVTTGKAMGADLLIQSQVEKAEKIDKRRVALFATFGFLYQGVFQYYCMNKIFEKLYPGLSLANVTKKVIITNFVLDPVFFFPTFYTFREFLNTGSFTAQTVTDALGTYYQNFAVDWTNSWSVWFPGHAVTYGLMPTHLRMPWVAFSSFGYVGLLSWTRGSYAKQDRRPIEDTFLQSEPLAVSPRLRPAKSL
mmetsp:Transcript_48845/g.110851  ORF Transcript_48845/g.110851 Transcript_48845/m.110851 type:complete len:213 (-) Transcript_48845:128-766(-)|eukprot:CAMPEP_0172621756 /NCGR_PEP_ID=MMETSP1068-20121228/114994_1 /TAXON_ID=35684 /ORGANISM="Pseudopedinella elastica, Strain CCMP716" /LENGTH=212 /DNA_ID=CAMNT_0013429647 /DNA_START=63 /DNA_END=701 /DNA_ORIENTATION=-